MGFQIKFGQKHAFVLRFLTNVLGLAYLSSANILFAAAGNDFDQNQTNRLNMIRTALTGSDKSATKTKAQDSVETVTTVLGDYENLGPNQRDAGTEMAAAMTTRKVVDQLVDAYTAGQGQKISAVAAPIVLEKYGLNLSYNSTAKTWGITLAGSSDEEKTANFEKAKAAVAASVKPEIWNALNDDAKRKLTNLTISKIAKELSPVLAEDATYDADLKTKLEAKSRELGDEHAGRIADLSKRLSVAKQKDATEKRLLVAERKTYQAVVDTSAEKAEADFCSDLANNISGGKTDGDVQRRLQAMSDDDPCKEAVRKKLKSKRVAAAQTKPSGEDSSSGDSDSSTSASSGKVATLTSVPNDDDTSSSGSHRRSASTDSLVNGNTASTAAQTSEQDQKRISDLEAANSEMASRYDTLARQNIALRCTSASSNKNPFALNSENEKNDRMIESLSSELEKKTTDEATNLVCQQSGANDGNVSVGGMADAAKKVITGLGIPEDVPLTAAQVRTLEGISKKATQQAGSLAGGLLKRAKLVRQLTEAAAKRALTRLYMEAPGVLDAASMNYLQKLSYSELLGSDGKGGALALYVKPQLQSAALTAFGNYFDVALKDLKEKNEITDNYQNQVECALALAAEATARYSLEADRQGALGVNRNKLRSLAVAGATSVTNSTTSKKVKVRR